MKRSANNSPGAFVGPCEMKIAAAKKLAEKLDLSVDETIIVDCTDTEIVFTSWWTGSHSLSIAESDRARVLEHWRGFLANQPKGKR